MRRDGFTLMELLISLALLGLIISMILNTQGSMLQLSSRAGESAARLREMSDLTGYLGDRVRSAQAARFSSSDTFTVNGLACNTTNLCMAVLTMQENTTASGVERQYLKLVYRMQARSSWTSTDKVSDAYADDANNAVQVLLEYRSSCTVTSTDPCQTFKNTFASQIAFTSMSEAFVADYLSKTNQAGAAIVPFDWKEDENRVTFSFQAKQRLNKAVRFFPPAAPHTLAVQARNVN